MIRFFHQQANPSDPWVELVDTDYVRFSFGVCSFGHGRGGTYQFSIWKISQVAPLPVGRYLLIYDDSIPSGRGSSFARPLFEGVIVEPPTRESSSHEWQYIADSAIDAAERFAFILNGAWAAGPSTGNFITRRVYNLKSRIDADAYLLGAGRDDMTVGEMIEDFILDMRQVLIPALASPSDGSSPVVNAELAGFDYKPGSKVVLADTTPLEAIRGLLDQRYPHFAMTFEPGTGAGRRQIHFHDVLAASTKTITIGDETDTFRPILVDITEVLSGAYTAVEIEGPLNPVREVFDAGSSLTELWTITDENNLTGTANGIADSISGANCSAAWQVTDPAKRALLRWLPTFDFVADPYLSSGTDFNFNYVEVNQPYLVVQWARWPGRTYYVQEVKIDPANGIVRTPAKLALRIKNAGSAPYWELPTSVQLVAAYAGPNISARVPTSGFSGEAFDAYGVQRALVWHDPSFSLGRRNGVPETSVEQVTQYTKLAEAVHKHKSGTARTGTVVGQSIDYSWLALNQNLKLDLLDDAGDPVTTWPLNDKTLYVTDVTYDFNRGMTSLACAKATRDYWIGEVDLIKELLGIQDLEQYEINDPRIFINVNGASFAIPYKPGLNNESIIERQNEIAVDYTAVIPGDQRFGEGGVLPEYLEKQP